MYYLSLRSLIKLHTEGRNFILINEMRGKVRASDHYSVSSTLCSAMVTTHLFIVKSSKMHWRMFIPPLLSMDQWIFYILSQFLHAFSNSCEYDSQMIKNSIENV